MFLFTLSKQFYAKGISLDEVPRSLWKRFDAKFDPHYGSAEPIDDVLDGRMQVRLGEDAVRFFYYDYYDGEGPLEEQPIIESLYKEVATISLTDVKETDKDILFLGRQCGKKVKTLSIADKPEQNQEIIDRIKRIKIIFHCALKGKANVEEPKQAQNQEEIKRKKRIRQIKTALYSALKGMTDFEKQNRLSAFPFAKNIQWNLINPRQDKKLDKNQGKKQNIIELEPLFVPFIQCCFLYFILDLENRNSDLAMSPYYDQTRDKLRKSMVYRLLTAKIKHSVYLLDGEGPLSVDEHTYKAGSLAELLMDPRVNECIPTTYYTREEHNDYRWFYNPEIELEHILDVDSSMGKIARIDDNLRTRIQNFFFTKHAVLSALKASPQRRFLSIVTTKIPYRLYLLTIAAFSAFATYCFLLYDFDAPGVSFFFENFSLWICLVGGCIFVLFVIAFLLLKSANLLMPRVLVALGIGWFTAFISEDLIKSQLEIGIKLTLAALIAVIGLVGALLYGEAKQHSPYFQFCPYSRWKNGVFRSRSGVKLFPIIVHSYFFALVFGIAMQFFIYPGLLENSEALPEIVYQDTFDDAEAYVMRLENFKEYLESYRQDLDGMYVQAGTVSGLTKGMKDERVSIQRQGIYHNDADLERIRTRGRSKLNLARANFNAIKDDIESRSRVNDSLLHIESNHSLIFGNSSYSQIDSILKTLENRVETFSSAPASFDRTLIAQLNDLDFIIVSTVEEVQATKVFVSANNKYDSLLTWSTGQYKQYEKEGNMLNILTNEAIDNHYFSKVVLSKGEKLLGIQAKDDVHIFPRMLILHALIVLIIAFVGQLIISDKSVTEPL